MENFFLTPSIPLAVYIAIAKKEKEESGFDSVLCIYDLRTSIRTTRTNNTHTKNGYNIQCMSAGTGGKEQVEYNNTWC